MISFTFNVKSLCVLVFELFVVFDEVVMDLRSLIVFVMFLCNIVGGENVFLFVSAFGASESFLYLVSCCVIVFVNDVFVFLYKLFMVFVIVVLCLSNFLSRL